jgi:hypothetical protein
LTLVLQYQGFDYISYYNGAFEDADSLGDLLQTEANAVALNLRYGIDSVNSIAYADPNYTDSLDALSGTIQGGAGLRVFGDGRAPARTLPSEPDSPADAESRWDRQRAAG